jgi:small subunit ribosomal protein S17
MADETIITLPADVTDATDFSGNVSEATSGEGASEAAAAVPAAHQAVAQERESGKVKVGRVVSNKMNKTIVVAVEHLKKHRIYKKTMRLTRKFKAHDEHNEAKIGDIVRIEESRPISKEKSWRLTAILQHANEI